MKKAFHFGWTWLTNFSALVAIFFLVYTAYLCYHILRFWFSYVR